MTPTLNLAIQMTMGVALLAGMILARRKQFIAHGICQTAVVLLNLIPIFFFMAPHFHAAALPGIPSKLPKSFYAVSAVHATFGTLAEFFGLYLILTGWRILPSALRIKRYKPWMRLELALWWLTICLGIATFYVWNVAGPAKSAPAPSASQPSTNANISSAKTMTVEVTNYEFKPNAVTVEAGVTVVWKNSTGSHTVVADDKGFQSEMLAPGQDFKRTFDAPGDYKYYCSVHGGVGGAGMSGTITVTPRSK